METLPEPGSRAAAAIAYMDFVKGENPRSGQPDFTVECWEELARLVDKQRFVRVGKRGEAMDWDQTVALMNQHTASPHAYTLRAVTEAGDRVFLQLDETITHDGAAFEFNSVYIYTFDAAGKIVRLEFYMH